MVPAAIAKAMDWAIEVTGSATNPAASKNRVKPYRATLGIAHHLSVRVEALSDEPDRRQNSSPMARMGGLQVSTTVVNFPFFGTTDSPSVRIVGPRCILPTYSPLVVKGRSLHSVHLLRLSFI